MQEGRVVQQIHILYTSAFLNKISCISSALNFGKILEGPVQNFAREPNRYISTVQK